LYSVQEMNRALVRTPHALGITDLGTVTAERLPVKVLKLNGIFPSEETIRAGRYPLSRTLAFVFRPDRLPPEARAFVEFARSEEGQRIVRASGYLPGE
jgi:phosphate transport system substrate-binding protein